ncbi:MAG: hypothetical protein IH853_12615, partial [Bacteroidetes bacterium]|nr:hypothetical protein [Bacteroidota bacterium]
MTKTRTKSTIYEEESSSLYDDMSLDLEALSDDELDTLLFDDEAEKPKSMLNLPTLAGLSLILVGIAYIFQQLGLWGAGIDLTVLASLLQELSEALDPQFGEIKIGDITVASKSTFIPAEERKVGLVFQDYALFPHLTVARNIAFGLFGLNSDK